MQSDQNIFAVLARLGDDEVKFIMSWPLSFCFISWSYENSKAIAKFQLFLQCKSMNWWMKLLLPEGCRSPDPLLVWGTCSRPPFSQEWEASPLKVFFLGNQKVLVSWSWYQDPSAKILEQRYLYEDLGPRILVPDLGTKKLVPRSCYQDLSIMIVVPTSWYQDPGTNIWVTGSRYHDPSYQDLLVPSFWHEN